MKELLLKFGREVLFNETLNVTNQEKNKAFHKLAKVYFKKINECDLNYLSLSDLKILIVEIADDVEGWRNTQSGELDKEGVELNDKLFTLQKIYDDKVDLYTSKL